MTLRPASEDHSIYRRLQRHFDRQAVGFPATWQGDDQRILRSLFSPSEAVIALSLTDQPSPLAEIQERAAREGREPVTEGALEIMFRKAAIGWKQKKGVNHWFLAPLVVGMYEYQDGQPTAETEAIIGPYLHSVKFGKTYLAVRPSQMRTIPIQKAIQVEHHVATYDHIRGIVDSSGGPFVVLPCICRESEVLKGNRCAMTQRRDTCVALGSTAEMVLRRGHGREVSREELLEVFRQSEIEGLVLQPANAQHPEFVCSCCGCCCGMLSIQRLLPHPVDFWTSSHFAVFATTACAGCGICVSRCQVKAIKLETSANKVTINHSRCIGCGLCVPTCPSKALRLQQKPDAVRPPETHERLYEEIRRSKRKPWQTWVIFLKTLLGLRQ